MDGPIHPGKQNKRYTYTHQMSRSKNLKKTKKSCVTFPPSFFVLFCAIIALLYPRPCEYFVVTVSPSSFFLFLGEIVSLRVLGTDRIGSVCVCVSYCPARSSAGDNHSRNPIENFFFGTTRIENNVNSFWGRHINSVTVYFYFFIFSFKLIRYTRRWRGGPPTQRSRALWLTPRDRYLCSRADRAPKINNRCTHRLLLPRWKLIESFFVGRSDDQPGRVISSTQRVGAGIYESAPNTFIEIR